MGRLCELDSIDVNVLDKDLNSAMHLAFSETDFPFHSLSDLRLKINRLHCATIMMELKESLKKPHLTIQNQKDHTPYDIALVRHSEIMKELQSPKDEIKDRKMIQESKRCFVTYVAPLFYYLEV